MDFATTHVAAQLDRHRAADLALEVERRRRIAERAAAAGTPERAGLVARIRSRIAAALAGVRLASRNHRHA
ncbi:hypothetical protein ARHIZOSPH14_26370 [Agromyces rhizosphaerae]|uniref:Uncharacterized protein n=1 Tax=Agromyces rhizosphaerae TaxID=88374 RepID=A0A9W6FQC7_9MICO|nr:hypothetical protein [Agromyces rhizosphaerae]GLI28395.1 hypothetical protein ARHIZOSPH14_26370 [Agromyces rhizosphaerae]